MNSSENVQQNVHQENSENKIPSQKFFSGNVLLYLALMSHYTRGTHKDRVHAMRIWF